MATEKTFYRSAGRLSFADATKSLQSQPGVEAILALATKAADADEAKSAGVNVGDLVYAATVRLAEFPPSDGGGEDKPKEESSEKAPPSDDAPSDTPDDSPDEGGDKPNPFGGDEGDPDEGAEPKLKGDDGIIHVLTELLHAVKSLGGGAEDPLADPGADPGLGGPPAPGADPNALPDIGAPEAGGGALPPPGGAPPLPPPVPQKSPLGGSFAHYDSEVAQITVLRRDASELGNKAMIAEAAEIYPTHMVAKIQRTGSAKVNGLLVGLPESNAAVVTLVKK